jgi:hypothetical protein
MVDLKSFSGPTTTNRALFSVVAKVNRIIRKVNKYRRPSETAD